MKDLTNIYIVVIMLNYVCTLLMEINHQHRCIKVVTICLEINYQVFFITYQSYWNMMIFAQSTATI